MQHTQPDFEPYIKKYGDLLEKVAEAFGECSATGDAVGTMFLLDSLNVIICKSDQILSELHKRTGTA